MHKEVEKRMQALTNKELHERNLMKTINTKVIPVASYRQNACEFTKKQLDNIDKLIKQELWLMNTHGTQASGERLYLSGKQGGRVLKNMKDMYEDTEIRVSCYMAPELWVDQNCTEERERETQKEGK